MKAFPAELAFIVIFMSIVAVCINTARHYAFLAYKKRKEKDHIDYWDDQKINLKQMMQWQKDNAPSAEDQARYYEYKKSKLSPGEFERWVNRQIEAQASIDKFLKE